MAGSSNVSGQESILFADNASFDGTQRGGALGLDGEIWIGSSTSPHVVKGVITGGPGVTISNGPGTIQVNLSGGGISIDTVVPNTGINVVPTVGGAISLLTANSTVKFNGTANTLTLDFSLANLVLGSTLPSLTSGTTNVGVGPSCLNATTSGTGNVVVGNNCGTTVSTGVYNTGMGFNCLTTITNGQHNCAFGAGALNIVAGGEAASSNVAVGFNALASSTGSNNIAVGEAVLSGGCSGGGNIGIGTNSLSSVTSAIGNVGIGYQAGATMADTAGGVYIGYQAGFGTTGAFNTVVGSSAYFSPARTETGQYNTYIGSSSGYFTTSGSYNTVLGTNSLFTTTGSYNTVIGQYAANSYVAAESSNICICAAGTASESNVMRIGTTGNGSGQVNQTFIAGIAGVTVANSAAVLIDTTTGQLGTVISSIRYKEDVKDLNSPSVLSLRPVSFIYKKDEKREIQIGLIAEEVQKVIPRLCIYNDMGEVESVKYHELPVYLLNEIKKLNKRIEELEKR